MIVFIPLSTAWIFDDHILPRIIKIFCCIRRYAHDARQILLGRTRPSGEGIHELHPTISEKPDPAVSAAMDEEFKRKGYVLLYKNGEAMGAIVHTNPSEIAKGSKPIRVVDFTADPIHIPGVPSNVGPDDTLLLALRAEKEKLSPRGIAALERMEEQAKRNSENPQTPPTPEP